MTDNPERDAREYWEPTRFNQLREAHKLFREKGRLEVLRHARVAMDNRCTCNTCFCCACKAVLFDPEERRKRGLP